MVTSPHSPHIRGQGGTSSQRGPTDRQTPRSLPFCWSQAPPPGTRGTGEEESPPSTNTLQMCPRAEVKEGISRCYTASCPPTWSHTHLSKLSSPEKQREGSTSFTPSPQESLLAAVRYYSNPQADTYPYTRLPETHAHKAKKKTPWLTG